MDVKAIVEHDAEVRRILGERLREARHSASLTQLQAGQALGIHESTISYFESGRSACRVEVLLMLCHLYDVEPAEILRGL